LTKPIRMSGFRLLPEGMRKCCKCQEVKEKKYFYRDRSRASGVNPTCKKCTNEYRKEVRSKPERKDLEVRRKWSEANRERLREQDALYRENNRDRHNAKEARRRARKEALPDTLTGEEYSKIRKHFLNSCAICNRGFEHMDHFIPLSCGHGGTYYENMVPMCARCNVSKKDQNPFQWAKTLDKEKRKNFDALVYYLASINGIAGVSEYEAYVDKCFK